MRTETKEKLNKTFFKRGSTPWNKGKSFNPGALNPNWSGGRYITEDGYVQIYLPGHPHAGVRGYVREHVLIAERFLGRPLAEKEIVHHIDENPSNNEPSNLFLFENQAAHKRHHNYLKSGKEQRKVSNLPNLDSAYPSCTAATTK